MSDNSFHHGISTAILALVGFLAGNTAAAPSVLHVDDDAPAGGAGAPIPAHSPIFVPRLPVAYNTTNAVELVDIDADGELEAIFLNREECAALFENNGHGYFSRVEGQLVWEDPWGDYAPFGCLAVTTGDVDGDSDPDVLIGTGDAHPPLSYDFGPELLFINDNGTFGGPSEESGLWYTSTDTVSLALGDLDGDGDLDFAAGQKGVGGIFHSSSIWHNVEPNPDLFVEVQDLVPWPEPASKTKGIVLADFDGDQDLDFYEANGCYDPPYYPQHFDRIWLNEGNGLFVEDTQMLSAEMSNTIRVAGADLDGDGDVDLVRSTCDGVKVHLNEGDGFSDGQLLPQTFGFGYALALGDLDSDGDLDLFVVNSADRENQVFLNEGSGTFSLLHNALPHDAENTRAATMGDVDDDGDLDLLVGNWGQNRVYINAGSGFFWCPWDLNGDGIVDHHDILIVVRNMGPCDGCSEDLNGDGIVNGRDVAAVATHFGPCP
jgi:hypothetical protein